MASIKGSWEGLRREFGKESRQAISINMCVTCFKVSREMMGNSNDKIYVVKMAGLTD
jgi:hypothetical protein